MQGLGLIPALTVFFIAFVNTGHSIKLGIPVSSRAGCTPTESNIFIDLKHLSSVGGGGEWWFVDGVESHSAAISYTFSLSALPPNYLKQIEIHRQAAEKYDPSVRILRFSMIIISYCFYWPAFREGRRQGQQEHTIPGADGKLFQYISLPLVCCSTVILCFIYLAVQYIVLPRIKKPPKEP